MTIVDAISVKALRNIKAISLSQFMFYYLLKLIDGDEYIGLSGKFVPILKEN